MQDNPLSSFVYENPTNPMKNPITVIFKEDETLSPDGVHDKEYKKGVPHRASSAIENRVFEHMIETGRAEVAGQDDKSEKPTSGEKVSKPSSGKKSGKKASKKESSDEEKDSK